MNDVITNKKLLPRLAIIIYTDKRANSSYANESYYLESREIINDAGKFHLMAPVPLANDVLMNIGKSFMKSSTSDISFGLIPEHLLYGSSKPGRTVVSWYRPAMKRVLNIYDAKKKDVDVNIPATLYLVVNKKLYVYALMDNSRPVLKTKLYNAPFFNIYEDGNVCLGSARVGNTTAKTFEQEAERFERGFFMAEQSGGHSANNCKTSLSKLWPALMKSKALFPSKKELVQHKKFKTLGDLFTKMIDTKHPHEKEID